ncbi:MAG: head GIN domain-containing protein [Ferruginibacter sp.]
MKKYLLLMPVIALFVSCNFTSGSGKIVSEKRNVASFHGVSASQGFNVEIRIGQVQEVVIEADDNLMGQVKTIVKGGILKISLDEHNVNNAHLKAFVMATSINSLETSSAASIICKDELNVNGEMQLNASSASKITVLLNAPTVNAESSSGSDIKLSGHTKNFDAESSSGATINAYDLLSENTKASGSSGANLKVHASVSLDASASSGANIKYRGGANVSKSVSSGGGVSKE